MFMPDATLAANAVVDGRAYAPAEADIPAAFDQPNWAFNPWVTFQRDWAGNAWGVATPVPVAVEGVVAEQAWTHLSALQRSHSMTFEYQVKAIAYLASLWFTSVTVGVKKYP